MQLSRQAMLLFTLNFLDALLTVYWVHNGFASEGNQLMASLLDAGYVPFLAAKLAVGATAAVVLWHWRNLRLAKFGLTFVLVAYIGLMGVHLVTGLSALGFISEAHIDNFSNWSNTIFAFLS